MTNKSALDIQVSGDHYKKLKMQPIELAYRVNGSPCFTKLAKYASRRKVDRLGDLKKAIHCIQLEKELGNSYVGMRLDTPDFVEVLSEFTSAGNLYDALFYMYHSQYDLAIASVSLILQEEFPDEKV